MTVQYPVVRMIADCQVEVYSIEGGTTFEWGYKDGPLYGIGGSGYTDLALAWEAAWLRLGNLGGGKGRLRGPGERWIPATQVNSQGDNVEWHSDWSLVIQAPDGLNDNLVENTHDGVFFFDVHLNGNKANQVGDLTNCISATAVSNFKVIRCKCVDADRFGIACWNIDGVELASNLLSGNDWNGINIGLCRDVHIYENDVDNSSDVGIAITGATEHFDVHNNIIRLITGTDGFADSHNGLSCEAITSGAPSHGKFSENEVYDCPGAGLLFTRISGALVMVDVTVKGNIFENVGKGISGNHTENLKLDGDKIKTTTDVGIILLSNNTNPQVSNENLRDIGGVGIEAQCGGQFNDNHLFNITGGHGYYINGARDNGSILGGSIDTVSAANKDAILVDAGTDWTVGGGIRIRNIARSAIRGGTGGGGDDNCFNGGHISECATGIYLRDGDDILITGWRIRVTGAAIDINHANVVSAFIDGNNLEGSGSGCADGLATTPMYGNNVNAAGTITRDLVPP